MESKALKQILNDNRPDLSGPYRKIVMLMITGDTMNYSIVSKIPKPYDNIPELKNALNTYETGKNIPVMILDEGVLLAHMVVPLQNNDC
jgi:hypothetical protein